MIAEAAKLLKGVSLKPLRLESEPVMSGNVDLSGVDDSWLFSVASVSDCSCALVDSGATNALGAAEDSECQVILPAVYLVDLGFTLAWLRKGCVIKHPRKGRLEVSVVKGCPLIPREAGLELLREYEHLRNSELKSARVVEPGTPNRVAKGKIRAG